MLILYEPVASAKLSVLPDFIVITTVPVFPVKVTSPVVSLTVAISVLLDEYLKLLSHSLSVTSDCIALPLSSVSLYVYVISGFVKP